MTTFALDQNPGVSDTLSSGPIRPELWLSTVPLALFPVPGPWADLAASPNNGPRSEAALLQDKHPPGTNKLDLVEV